MFYGLDVHERGIQVCAMDAAGHLQRECQIETTSEAIDCFAAKLGPADAVVLEATFHTWATWARLVGRAGRVVVANPLAVKAIAHARIKTDTIDARTLAHLLRADLVPEVAMPDEATWELRQLTAHRQFLGKRLVAVELPRDELGQAGPVGPVGGGAQEVIQVLPDDPVEHARFRVARLVASPVSLAPSAARSTYREYASRADRFSPRLASARPPLNSNSGAPSRIWALLSRLARLGAGCAREPPRPQPERHDHQQ